MPVRNDRYNDPNDVKLYGITDIRSKQMHKSHDHGRQVDMQLCVIWNGKLGIFQSVLYRVILCGRKAS